mgnify:CR=1 FL=1
MGTADGFRERCANTEMASQRSLLSGGIMWLVMHSRGMSDSKSRALGDSHSREKLNIHPSYYGLWLDALIETLHKHDPQFDAQLEQVWRSTLTPSIDMIKSIY